MDVKRLHGKIRKQVLSNLKSFFSSESGKYNQEEPNSLLLCELQKQQILLMLRLKCHLNLSLVSISMYFALIQPSIAIQAII